MSLGAYFQPFKNISVTMYLKTNTGMTDLSDTNQTLSNGVETYRLNGDQRYHCVIMDPVNVGFGKIGGGAAASTNPVVGILMESFNRAQVSSEVCVAGIVPVICSEAITCGVNVYANADGTIGLTATNSYVGIAMSSASAANEMVAVLLKF